MIVVIQTCWSGHADRFYFRALIAGGLLVSSDDATWKRKHATAMLDQLEQLGFDRSKIRFRHV